MTVFERFRPSVEKFMVARPPVDILRLHVPWKHLESFLKHRLWPRNPKFQIH